jgi:hypothetical protein
MILMQTDGCKKVNCDMVCRVCDVVQRSMGLLDRQLFAIYQRAVQLLTGASHVRSQMSDQIAQGLEQQLGLERLRGLA